MKRVKRLFACLLALTMMLGLSATAFAETTAGTVQGPENGGTVTFSKEYTLVGEGISPAETFGFTIAGAGVADGGVGANETELPSVGTAAYTEGEATTKGVKKVVNVTLPTYKSVGVYSYTITETAGNTAGVTYDNKSVTMKVAVVNDGNNGFKIAEVGFTKDGKKLADNAAAFNNTYTANKLSIKKTVAGNLGDKSKYFNFTVTLTKGEKECKLPATISGGSDGSAGKKIKITGTETFRLKHDETITIENLPEGVTYNVTEDAEDYTSEVTGDTSGTMGGEAKAVTFTNTKNKGIDTGVYLDNLPYILVFAGVLAIAVVFAVRRRRFED